MVTARFQFEASSRWRAFKSAVIVSIVEKKKGQRITGGANLFRFSSGDVTKVCDQRVLIVRHGGDIAYEL